MKMTKMLRQLLAAPGVIQAGGVADAGQARLVEAVGYPAVYMSGAYVNHTYGVADGTLTLSEIAQRVGEIADRISIPLIADADEGFGDVLKVIRTVREFEKAGAAAIHLEDMSVKKHGHPMPIQEMVSRLKAALDTRRDDDFMIIARVDAAAPWRQGVRQNLAVCEDEALERSVAYAEAGADVIMPMYPTTEWVKRSGTKIPKPLLLLAPELIVKEVEQYNVKIVLYATTMLARTFGFMKKQYSDWLAAGQFVATDEDRKNREEARVLGGVLEKEKMLAKYGK